MKELIISEKTAVNCHAERCPVCNGFGSVNWGSKCCNACKGQGYLIVPNSIDGERGKKGNEGKKQNIER